MEKLTIAEMKTCAAETLAYFIQTMPEAHFNEDDIIIEFAKQKDMAERAKALCELYVPDKIINETQAAQFNESIAANALIGRDKSAVIAAINHKIDKQSWRRILFHEFVHIYCAELEIEGEHFIDVYGSGTTPDENPEDKIRDGFISSGYVIWSEFIAQYYAITKTENRKHLFIEAVEYIYDLLHEVSVTSLENSKGAFAQACAYWLTCRDAEEALDGLNDPDWFIPDSEKMVKMPSNSHDNHAVGSETLDGRRDLVSTSNKNAALSIETLGGGNHFIELDKDGEDRLYLVVHSGSRNLGKQVCDFYQNAAANSMKDNSKCVNDLITELKRSGRETEIEAELKKLEARKVDRVLAYAEGVLFDGYLHDMAIVQRYADMNRKAIVKEIVKRVKLKVAEQFSTIHNYIDLNAMILRKGAISAREGERVLIPMNMRDGSLICTGKGNADWNYSAPHGAGRLMSRTEAKQSVTLSQLKKSMQGIFSTSINGSTLDESAFAYKPTEEIISNIGDTVEIAAVIKPLYNFKAADEK